MCLSVSYLYDRFDVWLDEALCCLLVLDEVLKSNSCFNLYRKFTILSEAGEYLEGERERERERERLTD